MIDATLALLVELGVEGTTIEAVAAESGVAKSTIYRHFGDRESLMVEAARTCIVEYPTPDSGSLSGDLHVILDRYDAEANQRINQLFPLLLDAATRDPKMREVVGQLVAERQRPLRTVVQLAQLRGEVDPGLDMEVAMAILIGPLTYRRMVSGTDVDDDFLHTVVPATIAGLHSTAPVSGTDR